MKRLNSFVASFFLIPVLSIIGLLIVALGLFLPIIVLFYPNILSVGGHNVVCNSSIKGIKT